MKRLALILLIALFTSGCFGIGGLFESTSKNTVTLLGQVIDATSHQPLPSAQVLILEESQRVVTNESGQFELTFVTNSSSISLITSKTGYWSAKQSVISQENPIQVTVELNPIQGELQEVSGLIDYALPSLNGSPNRQSLKSTIFSTNSLDEPNVKSPDELIVIVEHPSRETGRLLQDTFNVQSFAIDETSPAIILKAYPDQDVYWLVEELRQHPLVKEAYVNEPVFSLGLTPNDPFFSEQWNLPAIYLPETWPATTGARTVEVAVLDTGIDPSHPDLRNNLDLTKAYNVFTNENNARDGGNPLDPNLKSHGTHVAGIIGAVGNNGQGVAGAIWNISIIPIKVLDDYGDGYSWSVAKGIQKAIDYGVDIINLSLGAQNPMGDVHSQIIQAVNKGIVVIAAGGNRGNDTILYPAAYPEVISVGATNINHQVTNYSAVEDIAKGLIVEVFAPGGDESGQVKSTDLSSKYSWASGTSMAAPHVSGIIALLKAVRPQMTLSDLRSSLVETGIELDMFRPGRRLVNSYALIHQTFLKDTVFRLTDIDHPENWLIVERAVNPGRDYAFVVPEGTYRLEAFIDKTKTGEPNSGDWYSSQTITVSNAPYLADIRLEIMH